MIELVGGPWAGGFNIGTIILILHMCKALRTATTRFQGGILPAQVLATPLSTTHVPVHVSDTFKEPGL